MSDTTQIEFHLAESIRFEKKREVNPALEQAVLAQKMAEEQDQQDLILKARSLQARLLMLQGKSVEAESQADYVLSKTQATSEAVDAMIVKAICFSEKNQISKAEPMLQKAVDISRFIQYKAGVSNALTYLSIFVYIIRGKFTLALAAMEEVNQIDKETGETPWGLPTVKSFIFQIMGDPIRLRQSLDEMVNVIHPGTWIAGIYYFLWGQLAVQEGDYLQAEEYLRLALRIATQTGIPQLQVLCRITSSHLCRLRNEAATALSWAEAAVDHASRSGSHHLLGQALIERAEVEWLFGETAKVENSLQEAIGILNQIQADYDLSVAEILLSSFYLQKDHPESEKVWLKASRRSIYGGYSSIIEKYRAKTYPLIAYFLRSKNTEARKAAEELLRNIERLSPPPIRVKGLGQFSVQVGIYLIPDNHWNRRKSGEVFRYLLLRKGYSASKEEVLEEFWGDYDPETALDLLHQATSTIRRVLEPDLPEKFPSRYLRVEGERIFLILPPGSYLDFNYFEAQIPLAVQAGKPQGLQRILGIYLGDLFPMDQYFSWSQRKRIQLNELFILGMQALCQMWMRSGEFALVTQAVRQILDQDPWNEDIVLLGMQAYVQMGNKPKAIKLFMDLEKSLKDDLQISPRGELVMYAKEIRNGGS